MRVPVAVTAQPPVEFFPSLTELSVVRHGFVGRVRGIDVATDRAEALSRLDAAHRTLRANLGFAADSLATAEQVHGSEVAVIDQPLSGERCFGGVDGLITNQAAVPLGIYVADCCAIFLVDPAKRCLGLVHSGRKGTEEAIVDRAIGAMCEHFGSLPRDLVVQLSPCIRPPHYEVDFAAEIVRQVRATGVKRVHDSGRCTACDLTSYYSYRAEKARTGRMLALLALR
jgi:purine-nucleoside/S-methyl-5'-thioadenosine phosphorylase / adenosine deaminase